MSESKTSKRKILAEVRREQALTFRKQGLSYRDISAKMKISQSSAHKAVKTALARLREEVSEQAEDLRVLELERMDTLFTKAYNAAMAGDLPAIDRCLKIMERRARLCGLDEATRTEISGALLMSGEWQELKAVLIGALDQHPEARQAVLAAIAEKTQEQIE